MIITNDKLMEILERNLGLPMGDGGIFYIEDPGQKRINKIYFSKNNMQLYKCTADNTDVTITGNYKLYSLTNSDDYIEGLTGVGRGQVKYIQDVGTKYVDKVYIDRPTGKLYRCVTQTSSVDNDANFVENNLNSTDGKLQNLININDNESNRLEIKTGSVTSTNGNKLLFRKPFNIKCLMVLTIDGSAPTPVMQQLATWDRTGFTVKSINVLNGLVFTDPDSFYYIAIGY